MEEVVVVQVADAQESGSILFIRSELKALTSQVENETQICQASSQQPNVRLSVGAPPVAGGMGNAPFDDLAE